MISLYKVDLLSERDENNLRKTIHICDFDTFDEYDKYCNNNNIINDDKYTYFYTCDDINLITTKI